MSREFDDEFEEEFEDDQYDDDEFWGDEEEYDYDEDDYIKIMKSGSMKDLDDNEINDIARRNLKIYDEL